jgi:peptide/nickel transport system ATP-binding protein
LLRVEGLRLYYRVSAGPVKAVDGVSFEVRRGQTLALVGESGCGKSSLAHAIMRILPRNVHTYSGHIYFDGTDLMGLSDEELRRGFRWRRLSMVFQGAMNALNPVLTVGRQVAEPLVVHNRMPEREALGRAEEVLGLVGLPPETVHRYPHQLSGGMRQRVVIAMALIMTPELLILDEPTSALDVITQANIINLLKQLKERLRLTYIFITHDLALASELSDMVGVMYAGQIVEIGPAERVYTAPQHPYTLKLISSVPTLRRVARLEFIPGSPPDLLRPPEGCRFNPRCPYTMESCRGEEPPHFNLGSEHTSKCWLHR